MYAKPFTYVTQTGLKGKWLNTASATRRCLILLHVPEHFLIPALLAAPVTQLMSP